MYPGLMYHFCTLYFLLYIQEYRCELKTGKADLMQFNLDYLIFLPQGPITTQQMFTGVYRVIKGFFCNICRENTAIFTVCRDISADITGFPCRYCRKTP
jgi:hypothetical protein